MAKRPENAGKLWSLYSPALANVPEYGAVSRLGGRGSGPPQR